MLADEFILSLKNVTLENKYLLPDCAGIYYVIDRERVVWYMKRSRNLRTRWNSEQPHHRFNQLKLTSSRENKQFYIYFSQINQNQLNRQEKADIYKYQPRLNYTPIIEIVNLNIEEHLLEKNGNENIETPFWQIFSEQNQSIIKIQEKAKLIMTENPELTTSIVKETELHPVITEFSSNRFERKFIDIKGREMGLNLQIEIGIDARGRLFVRHYTLFNIYGWGIKVIDSKDDPNNVDWSLSNLNSKCPQLYNYSLRWLGYKLSCENILLIDREEKFEIETPAIMLPFRMFVELVEYLWLHNSDLASSLEKNDLSWFKEQSLSYKLAKFLYDNNLTLNKLVEQL